MCKYNEKCDSFWVPDEKSKKIVLCECFRDELINRRYKNSGARKNHFKRLEDLNDQYVFSGSGHKVRYKKVIEDFVRTRENIEYLIEEDSRIILHGSTGSGKTQLAITLAIEMLANFDLQKEITDEKQEKFGFYFLPVSKIKRNVFNDDEKDEIFKELNKFDVLILDDLVSESEIDNNQIPHVLGMLNDIVRIFEGLIIMTTNYNGNIKEYYNKKGFNRLSSVLITSDESEHGQYNSFFYNVKTQKDKENRKKRNTKITFA